MGLFKIVASIHTTMTVKIELTHTDIQVGPIYTDIQIEKGTKDLDLDEVEGNIRPGALDSFARETEKCHIKWGVNQTQEIGEGVLSHLQDLRLMLDENYKHPIKEGTVHPKATLYINNENRALAPTNRSFWFWKLEGEIEFNDEEKAKWITRYTQRDVEFKFVKAHSKPVSISYVTWKPQPIVVVAESAVDSVITEPISVVVEPIAVPPVTEPIAVELTVAKPVSIDKAAVLAELRNMSERFGKLIEMYTELQKQQSQ